MAGDALPDALRVRAKLAGLALGLLAVPFALLLLLVSGRWDPLLDLDQGAIEGLHGVALSHGAFVAVLNLISTIGSAWLYLPLFTALSIWLAAQGLRRLAAFVVVTVAREPMSSTRSRSVPSIASRPVLPEPVAHAGGSSHPERPCAERDRRRRRPPDRVPARADQRRRTAALLAAVVWVFLVCFSRVGLGVHFVSDVVAGVIVGAAWVVRHDGRLRRLGGRETTVGPWRLNRLPSPRHRGSMSTTRARSRLTASSARRR